MVAYYNEIDTYAAEWLRTLIMMGHIADGVVDTRSISEIEPNELREFTQCHFFAGIGVWSHALRLAQWPDDRPVWTGSCPCQPFSSAGRASGFADERHLWPHWQHLIRECRPNVVFGEQVASKDGLAWLDLVYADMEGEGYAFSPVDLCAAGVGAPHIRQRLYFVADAGDQRRDGVDSHLLGRGSRKDSAQVDWRGKAVRNGRFLSARELAQIPYTGAFVDPYRMANTDDKGSQGHGRLEQVDAAQGREDAARHGAEISEPCYTPPTNGYWRDADWLRRTDGKWRAVEPGTFPLAHGAAGRVGRLRAYGNAIVAQVAAQVIGAYMDVRG